jgi:hypothetical protein
LDGGISNSPIPLFCVALFAPLFCAGESPIPPYPLFAPHEYYILRGKVYRQRLDEDVDRIVQQGRSPP